MSPLITAGCVPSSSQLVLGGQRRGQTDAGECAWRRSIIQVPSVRTCLDPAGPSGSGGPGGPLCSCAGFSEPWTSPGRSPPAAPSSGLVPVAGGGHLRGAFSPGDPPRRSTRTSPCGVLAPACPLSPHRAGPFPVPGLSFLPRRLRQEPLPASLAPLPLFSHLLAVPGPLWHPSPSQPRR